MCIKALQGKQHRFLPHCIFSFLFWLLTHAPLLLCPVFPLDVQHCTFIHCSARLLVGIPEPAVCCQGDRIKHYLQLRILAFIPLFVWRCAWMVLAAL